MCAGLQPAEATSASLAEAQRCARVRRARGGVCGCVWQAVGSGGTFCRRSSRICEIVWSACCAWLRNTAFASFALASSRCTAASSVVSCMIRSSSSEASEVRCFSCATQRPRCSRRPPIPDPIRPDRIPRADSPPVDAVRSTRAPFGARARDGWHSAGQPTDLDAHQLVFELRVLLLGLREPAPQEERLRRCLLQPLLARSDLRRTRSAQRARAIPSPRPPPSARPAARMRARACAQAAATPTRPIVLTAS